MERLTFITACRLDHSNPGDVWIRHGIEHLIRESHPKPFSINYMDIFEPKEQSVHIAEELSDYIILCGTPQIATNYIPPYFHTPFYDQLRRWKSKNKKIANLYAGFCHQTQYWNFDEAVSVLVDNHKQFISSNFSVYDLIICRDGVTREVCVRCGLRATQLADSVNYAPDYNNILPAPKHDNNLYVVRNLGFGWNVTIANYYNHTLKKQGWKPIAHSWEDTIAYSKLIPELHTVEDPRQLLKVYQSADRVISLRTHGSVVANRMGCKVVNVAMDSRSNILDYLGVKTIKLDELGAKLPFDKTSTDVIESDGEKFKELWKKFISPVINVY